MVPFPTRLRLAALLLTFLAVLPAVVGAQRPSAAQAQQMLQARPELLNQLRQRITSSGMTPDQIRARLRAEGYPESLLDAYLPGGSSLGGAGSAPTQDVFSAVMALGIADSTDLFGLDETSGSLFGGALATGRTRRAAPELTWDAFRDVIRGDPAKMWVDSLVRTELVDGTRVPLRDSLGRDTTILRDRDSTRVPRFATSMTRRALRPIDMPLDSGFRLFGFDVFRRSSTQFEANLAGPVDPNYRLGPGDRLVLVLTGDVEAAYTLDVTREGFVVIPQVGRVDVANLTLGQLEDVLYARLGRVYSGVRRGGGSTRFSVSPARLRSNQVFVVGDVAEPGSYRISGAGTALTALYAAGGPMPSGSLRQVQVRRGGRTVATLDVYDYLLRGDASNDVRLENGDVLFVPVHGPRVRVTGQVVRPATYELKSGESLADLIQTTGGFTASATRRRVQIDRILPPTERTDVAGRDQVFVDVPAAQIAASNGSGVRMEAGDIVHVFPVAERVRNRVHVRGNVWAPGSVGYTPGMTVSQALRMAGGVRGDTYLGRVLVTRLRSDSTQVQLRTSLADTMNTVVNDLPLLEDDEVQVFSVTEFRPERYVAVSGAVRKSGRYPYREGMTLRDLVLLAGGVEENAFLQAAEVARMPEERDGGKLARTMRVPLDSTYLFERGPDGRYLGPPGLAAPAASAPEVVLQPYDNVLILEQPDWNLQRTVTVAGEVRFPGTYSLQSKTDRLSDLLQRAGGLTNEGYADGVVFFRRRNGLGRIGIDLPRVLRDRRNRDNLILQDGDSIFIPQFNAVVNVQGAVNSPVAVSYVPGRDIDFYINAAGGGSRKADLSRAYVTQPNGKVESVHRYPMLPDGKPTPRAGSTIMVPERDPNDRNDIIQALSTITPIITGLITALVLVKQL